MCSLFLLGGSESNASTATWIGQQESQDEVVEFADRYERSFAKRDPKVGTSVADVSAYDEKGDPFSLNQVKGKSAVLVFGCLT